jgi:dolichyl-phosphate-mannose--protein O-mannosyl transferase
VGLTSFFCNLSYILYREFNLLFLQSFTVLLVCLLLQQIAISLLVFSLFYICSVFLNRVEYTVTFSNIDAHKLTKSSVYSYVGKRVWLLSPPESSGDDM